MSTATAFTGLEPIVSASEQPTGTMEIMCHLGDIKTTWDRNSPEEVAAARSQFELLAKKGYRGFRVSAQGTKGEAITEFDPEAQAIIMAPPIRGG